MVTLHEECAQSLVHEGHKCALCCRKADAATHPVCSVLTESTIPGRIGVTHPCLYKSWSQCVTMQQRAGCLHMWEPM